MNGSTNTLLLLSLVAGLAACQRDAAPDPSGEAATATSVSAAPSPATNPTSPAPADDDGVTTGKPLSAIEVPPADTPTPDIAAGAEIVYTCEDGGELHVVYSGTSAKFALTDGRVVTLPRAASASKGGGDVYVGEAVALQRLGNIVQVEQGVDARRVCAETGGNA